jgi:hypothetical protein
MNNKYYIFLKFKILIVSLLFLFSCSSNFVDYSIPKSVNSIETNDVNEILEDSFAQFQDIPIPENSIMIIEKTLLLGEKENWIGRLVITNPIKPAKVFDFFKQKLVDYNWVEITSVRATTSILTYSLDKRVMTIQIEPFNYSNTYQSTISITMSPSIIPIQR